MLNILMILFGYFVEIHNDAQTGEARQRARRPAARLRIFHGGGKVIGALTPDAAK